MNRCFVGCHVVRTGHIDSLAESDSYLQEVACPPRSRWDSAQGGLYLSAEIVRVGCYDDQRVLDSGRIANRDDVRIGAEERCTITLKDRGGR